MALITDPDSLNQGDLNNVSDLAFTLAGVGQVNRVVIGGAATLPALADDEFFSIRNSSTVGNNGLYRVNDASPTTSLVTCEKVVGPNPVNLAAESTDILGTTGTSSEKSVHFDTPTLTFYLIEQGNLSVDGVQMRAFHSFWKEEWKSDQELMDASRFGMVGISFAAGQWVFGQDPSGNNNGWKPAENDGTELILTRRLFRDAAWDEINSSGDTIRKYFNVKTLPTSGAFEDPLDQAYYRFGTDPTDLGAAVDFEFAGEVNEPVKYFEEFGNPDTCDYATSSTITRASGSFITDGYQVGGQVTGRNSAVGDHNSTEVLTAVAALTLTVAGTPYTTGTDTAVQLAVNNDNVFEAFLRIRDADPSGKTFQQADLVAGGETQISSKIISLGLGNVTDNDIDETDANVSTNTPFIDIFIRYLAVAYNRAVDGATLRNWGIVIDVGTYSNSNGVSAGTALVTSANIYTGDVLADFNGGTLILHDATAPDRGTHTISGTPVNNGGVLEITLTSALTNSESSLSFTMQRAAPTSAVKQQIYEKNHFQLRQAVDINDTDGGVVNGKTADDMLVFNGANLLCGSLTPTNPEGAGSGVIIEGFDVNDTNNMFFFDNTLTSRNFPFVAAGTFTFNQGLVTDTDGEYWLFFEYTDRTNLTDAAVVSPSGDTYDLESPGSNLPALLVNDYIFIPAGGFADEASNGLFIVEVVNTTTQDYTIRKIDGSAVGAAEAGVTIDVDQNPYPSPDAVLVDDNGGTPLAADVNTLTIAFDFDYENNVQGGRTADTDANVVLVVAGLETAQVAEVSGLVITKNTGLAFSITSPLERNYLNV